MCVKVICLLLITILNNVKGTEFTTNNEIGNVPNNRYKRQEFVEWQFVECFLPPHPENGQWEVIGGFGTPGSGIQPNTLIKFSCKSGFNMESETKYFICDTDWDPSKMPRCIETLCLPLTSSSSVKFVKCFNSNEIRIECNRVPNGGTATTTCAPYYELSSKEDSTIQCQNGTWSGTTPECNVICGQTVKEQELEMAYKNEYIPKYPWIATLFIPKYGELYPMCSGSLISTSHVLTAAHCVLNLYYNSSGFQVAAGQIFQEYGNPRDILAQYVAVVDMMIHPDYARANLDNKGDIAVLKTKRPFRLSPLVQPVCIRGLDDAHSPVEDRGVFAVWSISKDSGFTEYVESNLNHTECLKTIPREYLKEIYMVDKLCVHFTKNVVGCAGEGGSGLAVKKTDNNRFFIQAVLTIGSCFSSEPTAVYVKIWDHYDFIIEAMDKL